MYPEVDFELPRSVTLDFILRSFCGSRKQTTAVPKARTEARRKPNEDLLFEIRMKNYAIFDVLCLKQTLNFEGNRAIIDATKRNHCLK